MFLRWLIWLIDFLFHDSRHILNKQHFATSKIRIIFNEGKVCQSESKQFQFVKPVIYFFCNFLASVFEEPEDPTNRSFFSEIISSISDVKFSHNGRYMVTRDYLSIKVWDLLMETKPIETYQVHEYLRSKLCSLYENDCIFDKFECSWSGDDR